MNHSLRGRRGYISHRSRFKENVQTNSPRNRECVDAVRPYIVPDHEDIVDMDFPRSSAFGDSQTQSFRAQSVAEHTRSRDPQRRDRKRFLNLNVSREKEVSVTLNLGKDSRLHSVAPFALR